MSKERVKAIAPAGHECLVWTGLDGKLPKGYRRVGEADEPPAAGPMSTENTGTVAKSGKAKK